VLRSGTADDPGNESPTRHCSMTRFGYPPSLISKFSRTKTSSCRRSSSDVGGRSSTGNRGAPDFPVDERSTVTTVVVFDLFRKGIAGSFLAGVSIELRTFVRFDLTRRAGTRRSKRNLPLRPVSFGTEIARCTREKEPISPRSSSPRHNVECHGCGFWTSYDGA
jgi:hypothetical protein